MQHNPARHNPAQHSPAQHSPAQPSPAQCSTVQYTTVQVQYLIEPRAVVIEPGYASIRHAVVLATRDFRNLARAAYFAPAIK